MCDMRARVDWGVLFSYDQHICTATARRRSPRDHRVALWSLCHWLWLVNLTERIGYLENVPTLPNKKIEIVPTFLSKKNEKNNEI